jgi:hypothetical protein
MVSRSKVTGLQQARYHVSCSRVSYSSRLDLSRITAQTGKAGGSPERLGKHAEAEISKPP